MSREIKFRTWLGKRFWFFDISTGFNNENKDVCNDPEQFTGLLDKNGKEIFESDLCLINEIVHRIEYIQEFMTYCPFTKYQWTWYNEGSNHFKYCYEESHLIDGTVHFLSQLESYEIEIIGSIHENPELLK